MSRLRDLLIKRRSEVAPLIHWDFSGKSNADAGTIVEDLTGNGYDLELKNFAFDNVSGYNGYPTDFRKWTKAGGTTYDGSVVNIYENKIVFDGTISDSHIGAAVILQGSELSALGSSETLLIKVNGLKENQQLRVINQTSVPNTSTNIGNGISFIDIKNYNNPDAPYPSVYIVYNVNYNNGDKTLNNVTVEIVPLYPDQLVFNNNKAQTVKPVKINTTRGFTAIVRRQFIQDNIRIVVLGQQGSSGGDANYYIRDYKLRADGGWSIYNFGSYNSAYDPTGNLMWSTLSKFFNGQINTINRPKVESPDDAPLMLGAYTYNSAGEGNFAIREVYIFDRDLTQSQIENFISDNMIPLPEVYYDVEKQGTLNEHTTKDKLIDFSGNENHGTLHNFTFDESNGWGYYPLDTVLCDKRRDGKTVVINGSSTGVVVYNQRLNVNAENFTQDVVIPEFRVKVTGLSAIKEAQPNARIGFVDVFINDGGINTSHYYSVAGSIDGAIHEDGIYTVLSHTVQFSNKQDITSLIRLCDLYFIDIVNDGSVNITVEFLPTDEDCLRFNNTSSTYVDIDTLTKGFKTVFMVFNPAAMGQVIYDQRTPEALNAGRNKFAIYGENNSIAWNAKNTGGVTYINGELNNTKLSSSLIGQKHCAALVNDTVEDGDTTIPIIGGRTGPAGYYADMKLYKFLGFKEALSEKQIKMVIEKYGLQVD